MQGISWIITTIICLMIGCGFIWFMCILRPERRAIKRMQGELDERFSQEETIEQAGAFQNPYLKQVSEEYIRVLKAGGAVKLNTSAIIESQAKKRTSHRQWMKYLSSVVISLGLLGTFLGLTVSITALEESLQSYTYSPDVSIGDQVSDNPLELMDSRQAEYLQQEYTGMVSELVRAVKDPIAGMTTAFITSIAGLIASIIMTSVYNRSYLPMVDQFEDSLTSYMDNRVAPFYVTDASTALNQNLEKMSGVLTGSISEFAQSVTGLSKQMESSVSAVDITMEKLNAAIGSMNQTVGNLDAPLIMFGEKIQQFGSTSEMVGSQISELQTLSRSLTERVVDGLRDGISIATERIVEATDTLHQSVQLSADMLSESVQGSIATMENTLGQLNASLKSVETSNVSTRDAAITMKEASNEFMQVVSPLNEQVQRTNSILQQTAADMQRLSSTCTQDATEAIRLQVEASMEGIASRTVEALKAGMNETLQSYQEGGTQLGETFKEFTNECRKLTTEQVEMVNRLSASLTEKLTETGQLLEKSYRDFKGSLEEYGRTVGLLKTTVDKINDFVITIDEKLDQDQEEAL